MYQAKRRPTDLRPSRHRLVRTALVLAPVLGLAALVAVLLLGGFVRTVSGGVPVESVVVEDVRLTPGNLALTVRNDSQTPVTIGQVTVDDAFRPFTISASTVDRLEAAEIDVPYPWEPGVPVHVSLLTSTGTVISHEIASPSLTPASSPTTMGTLALIGLAMASIPVALGLLWLPVLRRASPRTMAAVMAFTLGLLVFLLVDSAAEGLDLAGTLGSLNGVGVFALGALGAMAVFAAIESLGRRNLAWLVAIGIGLHNLGEGLAVGTAMRIGEVALGSALIIGFAIHNLTEGVAIAAPLADRRTSTPQLLLLAAAAGLPAVPGLWLGGLTAGGLWAVLGLGIASGAIAQVVFTLGRQVVRRPTALTAATFTAAVGVMYLTGILA
jgi:zinc transporter, ZIP family